MGDGCSCGLPGGMPNSDPDHCVSCCEDGHDKLRAEIERLKNPVISIEGSELKDMKRVCKERDDALLQVGEAQTALKNIMQSRDIQFMHDVAAASLKDLTNDRCPNCGTPSSAAHPHECHPASETRSHLCMSCLHEGHDGGACGICECPNDTH